MKISGFLGTTTTNLGHNTFCHLQPETDLASIEEILYNLKSWFENSASNIVDTHTFDGNGRECLKFLIWTVHLVKEKF